MKIEDRGLRLEDSETGRNSLQGLDAGCWMPDAEGNITGQDREFFGVAHGMSILRVLWLQGFGRNERIKTPFLGKSLKFKVQSLKSGIAGMFAASRNERVSTRMDAYFGRGMGFATEREEGK